MTRWTRDGLLSETGTRPGDDSWETPRSLFEELNREFQFDLDAAASDQNTLVSSRYITKQMNSLDQDWSRWGSRVWLNPPYGRGMEQWIRKAYEESLKGITVVVLIFARTDTRWWQRWAMKAAQVRLIEGRVHFNQGGKTGPATAPSAVLIFSEELRVPQFSKVKLPRN